MLLGTMAGRKRAQYTQERPDRKPSRAVEAGLCAQSRFDLSARAGSCQKGRHVGTGGSAGAKGHMRLILRIIGTILLALALILIILDGTRSLGQNTLVFTPLGETWRILHKESLAALQAFIQTRFFGALLDTIVGAVLSAPGWVVLGIPGALLGWLGRSKRTRVFIKQNQI